MRRRLLLGLFGTLALAAASLSAASPPQPAARATPDLRPGDVADIATGVARVHARSCRGRSVRAGTGFLIGQQVVMTARHLLTGTCGYTVILGGRAYGGSRRVFWYTAGARDETLADVATLELSSPVRGHVLAFARRTPKLGTTISVIALPLGNPLRLNQGPLVATPRAQGVPFLEVGIAAAKGSSGSPYLDSQGDVVGILQRSFVSPTTGPALGVDLVRWWGTYIIPDLCRTYPHGGISGCRDQGATTNAGSYRPK
jgi:hypothetical protein